MKPNQTEIHADQKSIFSEHPVCTKHFDGFQNPTYPNIRGRILDFWSERRATEEEGARKGLWLVLEGTEPSRGSGFEVLSCSTHEAEQSAEFALNFSLARY